MTDRIKVTESQAEKIDPIEIIAAACEDLRRNGFYFNPRIVARSDFDLSGFKEQESDIPGVEVEYVDQRGPGIAGDDYHGTMAWPIGDKLFICEYAS